MTVLKYSLRNQTTTNHLSILESALHLLVTKSRSTTLYYIGLIDASVTGFDFLSNVPSFRLARIDKTSSYSVLPVDCIMNGAVMMPEPTPGFDPATPPPNTRYWALLSPREHEQYQLYFQQ